MLYDDPELYDEILPVSAEHVTYYERLAARHPGGVLELACGSGQLLVPLAHTVPEVYGLDSSPGMLAAAEARARTEGVTVTLAEGDMRDFDLGRRFSLIFIARHSLLHLLTEDDYRRFFRSVARHLRPGGVLAFDIFNPDPAELVRGAGERTPFTCVDSPVFGDLIVEATDEYDPVTQVDRATWYVSTPDRADAWVLPVDLRMILPAELTHLLTANGFHLLRRDGNLTGTPWTPTSPRQSCICTPTPPNAYRQP
ncbi:class I SAM-dependent methyltransferase [Streptomyces sp. CA-111067]|uniref:class I SAM-dependent methyltransferase n=1 Tax=Streptomyces sp. CA-111067 TaxID=3240046 RepID=UPI003D9966FC